MSKWFLSLTVCLQLAIRFLVQLANRRGRNLAAPKRFCNILNTAYGNTSKIHLHECFFYTGFTAAVTFNNGCLKRNSFQTRYLKRNLSGSCREAAVIMTTSVSLTLFAAFVSSSLGEFFCFGFQQAVQRFFHASTCKLLQLPLDYFRVQLYNLLRHSLLSFQNVGSQLPFYQSLQTMSFFNLRNLLYLIAKTRGYH